MHSAILRADLTSEEIGPALGSVGENPWVKHLAPVRIAQNHPFLDGNKRTALAAALLFLWMNDLTIEADETELSALVLGVDEGRVSKAEAAVFFQKYARGVV